MLAHLHHPIAEPFSGGTEMHTSLVVDELVRRGHEVTLFAKGGSRTSGRLVPLVGDDFVFGQMPGPGGDRSGVILDVAVRSALAAIRQDRYDVVLNNSFSALPYTELAAQPMITILHTPPTLEKVLAVITDPAWAPDPVHAFVSVSEVNSASWRRLLAGVRCIPNGIRLDGWSDASRAEPDLAVWAGRITPEKGLHLAIDAVRATDLRLEISGPIADRTYFDTEIVPRLGDRVTHVGHLAHDELARQLGRGAVFVSSSVWAEPFGLTLVEAMSCGTPVAAFATGAAAEIVTPAAGVLARAETPEALAVAIEEARHADRGAVRRRAEDFDAQIMVDRYEELLREVVDRRRVAVPVAGGARE
ncbi:glycosyltransferase family 4 protein [Microlunatus aurantiacus]|uniref:Glycosyltransferase family 4 protein n=1 Tax=Microlunatus aurantiacus TaxID=446786 RepID=A0ABP7D0G1_9ACTN